MTPRNQQIRVGLSILGLILISISMYFSFTGASGFLSWGLLGAALVVMLISSRFAR